MTRPRTRPSSTQALRNVMSRLALVERATRSPLAPVAAAATAVINQTAPQTPYMALVNPVGTQITWWVLVTVPNDATLSMRLRSSLGGTGDTHTLSGYSGAVATLSLPITAGWEPGDMRMVYLDAWIDINSATILPVRAQIA